MYINIHNDSRREETDGGRRERGEGGMGVGCVSKRGWGIAYIYVYIERERKDESFA